MNERMIENKKSAGNLFKRAGKTGLRYVLALVLSVLAAAIVMILLYCLPVDSMKMNVYRSIPVYDFEGSYPQWAAGYKMTQLDNVTDGYMLMEALYPGNDDPVQNAMNNPYLYYEGVNPEKSATQQSHDVEGVTGIGTYGRYWHGYLLFLKPLLMIFEVSDLRIINMILCLGLSFYLFALIRQKLGRKVMAAAMAAWLVINPVSVIMSFQFSTTFYVMLTASILVMKQHEWLRQKGRYGLFFLFIGIVTNFIDFLTYPMVGMAIPMILAVMLQEKENSQLQSLAFCIRNSIVWVFGYGGMWLGKWITATILTGQNYIVDALNEAKVQSDGQEIIADTVVSPIGSIYKNLRVIVKWPFLLALAVIAAYVLYCLVRKRMVMVKRIKAYEFTLCLLAVYPLVWFSVLQSHSISCYWFTYRNLSVSVLAVLILLGNRVERRDTLVPDDSFDTERILRERGQGMNCN